MMFGTTGRLAIIGAAAFGLAGCASVDGTKPAKVIDTATMPGPGEAREPASEAGWALVWSDEFEGTAIDRTKWDFDLNCWGGGNEERQCYTDSPANASVANGVLSITARKEEASGPAFPLHMHDSEERRTAQATKPFTSARMVTRDKAAWTYGRIEVRAKLPGGQGVWPAIWMLPEPNRYGGWAASGEIDILEAVNLGIRCEDGCEPGGEDTILGTLHFGGLWPDNAFASTEVSAPDVLDGFHTFGVIWAPGSIEWTYDGRVFARRTSDEWWSSASGKAEAPFDKPFHLILNLAVGGGLAENRGLRGVDETGFPKTMEVDWVRVYECAASAGARPECSGE